MLGRCRRRQANIVLMSRVCWVCTAMNYWNDLSFINSLTIVNTISQQTQDVEPMLV